MFKQKAFLENIKPEDGDTNNPDTDLVQNILDRIGANILRKRIFKEGVANWPEEVPFLYPVFFNK